MDWDHLASEISLGFKPEGILNPPLKLQWVGRAGDTPGKAGRYILTSEWGPDISDMSEWGHFVPEFWDVEDPENALPPDSEESGGKSSSDPTGSFLNLNIVKPIELVLSRAA